MHVFTGRILIMFSTIVLQEIIKIRGRNLEQKT